MSPGVSAAPGASSSARKIAGLSKGIEPDAVHSAGILPLGGKGGE